MISIRTLVNTTIFWFVVLIIFWGYTRWINNVPAQELLHTIGWDNFDRSDNIDSSYGNQDNIIANKLDNIEKMIQATNMNCSLGQLNTGTITAENSNPIDNNEENISKTINIPVFDTIRNGTLPTQEQATSSALLMVQRPILIENPTVNQIFDSLKNLVLTPEEQKRGLINVFTNTSIQIAKSSLKDNILTIVLSNTKSLSSTEFNLVSSIIEKVYTQFPGINSVSVQSS